MSKIGNDYKIKIVNDYNGYELKENDLYYVNYKLLYQCELDVWNKILQDNKKN